MHVNKVEVYYCHTKADLWTLTQVYKLLFPLSPFVGTHKMKSNLRYSTFLYYYFVVASLSKVLPEDLDIASWLRFACHLVNEKDFHTMTTIRSVNCIKYKLNQVTL